MGRVPAPRSSWVTQGHSSRHGSSHTLGAQETHWKPRDGSVSALIQNHENPGARLPRVRPLPRRLPSSRRVHAGMTGRGPGKPQGPWPGRRPLKLSGQSVTGDLAAPASVAHRTKRVGSSQLTEENHRAPGDRATRAGAAGTCLPPPTGV